MATIIVKVCISGGRIESNIVSGGVTVMSLDQMIAMPTVNGDAFDWITCAWYEVWKGINVKEEGDRNSLCVVACGEENGEVAGGVFLLSQLV